MKHEIKRGAIAKVLCGRGEGRLVLVLREEPDGRLAVSDGKRIRVEMPKSKNRKHLAFFSEVEINEADALSNRRVREMIRDARMGIIEQEGLFCQRMM